MKWLTGGVDNGHPLCSHLNPTDYMAKIETRTVYRKEDGLRTIINVDDYDPEIHSTKIPKDKLSPEKYAEEREQGKKLAAKALGNAPKAAAEKLKGNG